MGVGSGVDELCKVEDGAAEESGPVLEVVALVFEAAAVAMAGITAIAEDDGGAMCSLFLGSSQQVPLVSMLQQNLPF